VGGKGAGGGQADISEAEDAKLLETQDPSCEVGWGLGIMP
jgi:hypothetical protein